MAAVSFFAQQERARRASATLVVLYAISVVGIVFCVNAVVLPVYGLWIGKPGPNVLLTTTITTLVVIALGSLEIVARMSLGKGELANLLSGREISRGTARDDERRLVNVVDEMAIASGVASPPLYVLNREQGINAFTAGISRSEAVVVVTQGALEQLSRDELQAVIAHEFSHILNGDIRVNLRAVYVLQGIVFLAAIGRFMMQYYSGAGTDEGRRFIHLPLAAIGVGVFAVGSIGLVFCRVIQSALARERENLADASAVQFTRNADALCGALARIHEHGEGARVRNWHADALAHMLFAPSAGGWFATHPPIEERMRRTNPRVPPEFYFEKARKPREADRPQVKEKAAEKPKTIVPKRETGVSALIAAIGAPEVTHLEYAEALLAYLPLSIRESLGASDGAQAVMLGLVFDAELSGRTAQLAALAALGQEDLARKGENLRPLLAQLDRAYRLPVVALAVPVLKKLDEPGRAAFLGMLRAAIQADRRYSMSEFVLETLLEWTLGPASRRAGGVGSKSCGDLEPEIALVLSLLAHTGGDEARAKLAFEKGRESLALPGLAPTARDGLQLARAAEAFARLAGLAPAEKERLLAGFGEAVGADEDVKLMEHELLRAVACVLDCPMPPTLAALDPRLLRK